MVDTSPLHWAEREKNFRFAYGCRTPEQPRIDEKTAYDWRCKACVIAATVSLVIQGDIRCTRVDSNGHESRCWLSQLVEETLAELKANGQML